MKQGAASNPPFIEPMMALRVRNLPVGNWLYKLKFNGYRAVAFKAACTQPFALAGWRSPV
jgi:hypothetical protein